MFVLAHACMPHARSLQVTRLWPTDIYANVHTALTQVTQLIGTTSAFCEHAAPTTSVTYPTTTMLEMAPTPSPTTPHWRAQILITESPPSNRASSSSQVLTPTSQLTLASLRPYCARDSRCSSGALALSTHPSLKTFLPSASCPCVSLKSCSKACK